MISRSLSRYSEKQLVMIYCFSKHSPEVTQRPEYLGSERSRGSIESSRKKRESTTVRKHSVHQSKIRMLWKPMVVGQWWRYLMQIRMTPWHLSDTICSARKLRELRLSSHLKDCHQPHLPVDFTPCGLTTRLWSGWAVPMEWSRLSGDGG